MSETIELTDDERRARPVAVKGLEWHVFCSRSGNCQSETPLGEYVIQHDGFGFGALWMLYLPYQDISHGKGHDTLDAAKAAAQCHFDKAIRSALIGDGAQEGVKWVELDQRVFNVAFERGEHTHLYLGMKVSFEEASAVVGRFIEQYVGKPFPNGKGFYPFTNPRVVLVIDGGSE